MLVSPISTLLRLGKSTPAILAKIRPPLSLSLFVALICADYSYNTFSADYFTFIAHFLY
jgi:hypothetical protein